MRLGLDVPAAVGMAEAEVVTPALIVDLGAFEANLDRMRACCAALGVALRAHAKTHKSADIARAQMARGGAVGICCQKTSEAEALVDAGVPDVLIANEVRGRVRLDRLAALTARARLGVCVDDPGGVAELSAAMARAGAEIDVLVEVDVGAGRCGAAPGEATVALARQVAASPGLRLRGIQAYHGRAQHVRDAGERRAVIDGVLERVRETVRMLREAGLAPAVVTGAGTGTFPFEGGSGLYTEVQAGSYCLLDADYARVEDPDCSGVGGFGQALFVLSEVMSATRPGHAVCDAGLKAVAVDSGLPIAPAGVRYVGASDEHGVLAGDGLAVGRKLRLVPGHCDPTVNLHDWLVAVRGGRVEALWPVTARGRVF